MSIPDTVVGMYARLCSDLHPREIDALEAGVRAGGAAANEAKRAVARSVVALYHGAADAAAAEERFNALFQRHEVPADAPEFALPDGDPLHVPALLVAAGLAASTSAARRDVDAGAVRIDGAQLAAKRYDVPRSELAGAVITSGKRKAARLL
jgi:tyrosyl-tRNA synthetase